MQLLADNASTTLATGIGTTDVSLTVANTGNFPAISNPGDYFYITLADIGNNIWELLKVTATVGNVFTIIRAQDNTIALSWIAGSIVELRFIAQNLRDVISYSTAMSTALTIALS